jgi:DNA repair protein RadC
MENHRYTYRIRTVDVQVSESFDRDSPIVGDPAVAEEFFRSILRRHDADQEHFMLLAVDTQHRVIGYKVTSSGTRTQTPVDAARVFKLAFALDADAILIAHNHPSGQLEPSRDDLELTRRLVKAGELIGLTVYDHVILAGYRALSLRRSRPGLFAPGSQMVERETT